MGSLYKILYFLKSNILLKKDTENVDEHISEKHFFIPAIWF